KALGDHERVAILYSNLGATLDGLGKRGEALQAYDKAIAITAKVLGPANPGIASDEVNRASVYAALGNFDQGIAETLKALVIYGNSDAKLDPIRTAYWALARVLDAKGYRRAAVVFAKEAVNAHQDLRIRNEKLPVDLRASLAHGLRWVFDLLARQEVADGSFA